MKDTEEVHKLTDAVYKNLVDNFNNGVRQLLLTGKTYHKALLGVTSAAHAYNDALTRIGSMAKMCRGGTDEIGAAIVQIAEAQKSVQAQLEDSTKALFTELILPLEQKLDKEFKRAHSAAKKYSQGQKVLLSPYTKAFDSLKKFRKKTKNKYVYDNEKEAQHMRTLSKCQEKLDEYRIQGLRSALLEERKCHCFLLQRLCAISGLSAAGHRRGVDLYTSLGEWQDLCSSPHSLPRQGEQFIAHHLDDDEGYTNGGPTYNGNGFLHRETGDTQSLGNELRRSKSTHDMYRRSGHFDGTKTLPQRTHGIPPPPSISPQVQGIYSFSSNIESQLSFIDGDIITLLGDKSEGWQYGENTRTHMMGWFPLSFTQPVAISQGRESPEFRLTERQRGKSVGDLLESRSLSEHHHFMYDNDVPGNVRRPKSLYEGPSPSSHHQHSSAQAVRPTYPFTQLYDPVPIYSHSVPISMPFSDPDQIYQHIPVPTDNIQNAQITSTGGNGYASPARQPSKPPPPPPPPPQSTRNMPDEDYGFDDDTNFQSNPMFSNVSLRRTRTNDRSGPKLN